jgi:diguanylate cyclase (GGDEF)-like protein
MNATAIASQAATVERATGAGARRRGPADMAAPEFWPVAALLHTTLDVEKVIALFARELARQVPYASFSYDNPGRDLRVVRGSPAPHSLSYRLLLEDRPLGEMLLTRDRQFDAAEVNTIENLISGLVYALRNALLYQQALAAAHKDPLTGVANRAALESTLQREVGLSRRHRLPLSVLMIDIDKFKGINDRHGHAVGDRVLQALTRGVADCIRTTDVLARYGGEEFVIVLPGTDTRGAQLLAERICRHVAGLACAVPGAPALTFTISVGVASLSGDSSCAELIDRADQAMYRAKHQGGNRVAVL